MFYEKLVQEIGDLCEADGPSGYEGPAVTAWADLALRGGLVPELLPGGNVAVRHDAGPGRRLLLSGHIDEVGIQVRYLDDEYNCIRFQAIGGWDPAVLIGQRVRIRTRAGLITGVVAREGTHLMTHDEQEDKISIEDLWIDVGASSFEELERLVRVGDPGVIDAPLVRMGANHIVGRALDNRLGAYAVLNALSQAREKISSGSVTALANTREEILQAGSGAAIASRSMDYDAVVVVDLSLGDHIQFPYEKFGKRELGSGVILHRGGVCDEELFDELEQIANRERIPYTVDAISGTSGTDADEFASRGMPTALLAIPSRYMHTPVEVVDLRDLVATIRLLSAFAAAG